MDPQLFLIEFTNTPVYTSTQLIVNLTQYRRDSLMSRNLQMSHRWPGAVRVMICNPEETGFQTAAQLQEQRSGRDRRRGRFLRHPDADYRPRLKCFISLRQLHLCYSIQSVIYPFIGTFNIVECRVRAYVIAALNNHSLTRLSFIYLFICLFFHSFDKTNLWIVTALPPTDTGDSFHHR